MKLVIATKNLGKLKEFKAILGGAHEVLGMADAGVIGMLNRLRGPFNVAAPGYAAAAAALGDRDFVNKAYEQNRKALAFLYDTFDEMRLEYIPSEANFVMVDVRQNGGDVFEKIIRNGILVRSGVPLGMKTFIRVTTGTMEQMEQFVSVLKRVL